MAIQAALRHVRGRESKRLTPLVSPEGDAEQITLWAEHFASQESEPAGRRAVAWIVASYWLGRNVLPSSWSDDPIQWNAILSYAFGPVPGVWKVAQRTLLARAIGNEATTLRERRALRTTLAVERQQEVEDLCALLLEHGSPAAERSVLNLGLARALAFGSLGPAHLWHDLGLCDRPQLRILIGTFFPAMIERNVGDMRWKRFFYRQLCEVGGDYVCRAPTCGECSSFTECFPSSQRG